MPKLASAGGVPVRGATAGLRLSRPTAERCEGCRRVQPRGEIANVRFHRGMPKAVEAEEIHFLDGLFGRPFLNGHAIKGGENAGPIIAEAAVHEDFLPRIVSKKQEKLDDLFVGWGRPATDGNVDKTHAQRFGVLAFPRDFVAVLAAEVDDGGDAQDFQFREAHFPGLRAAVKGLGDFSGVGNSSDVKFFPVSKRRKGGSVGRRGGWRRRLRKKEKRKKEKEGEHGAGAFHFDLDACSVTWEVRARKALRRKRLNENSTTTNRHDVKMSTTFSVFLLTENFLPLILRVQIRGTWKRQTDRIGDEARSVWARETARVQSEKIEREVPAPRPYLRRSTCC